MRLRIIERVGETCARRQYAVEQCFGGEPELWSVVQFFEYLDEAQFFFNTYGEPKVLAEREISASAISLPPQGLDA